MRRRVAGATFVAAVAVMAACGDDGDRGATATTAAMTSDVGTTVGPTTSAATPASTSSTTEPATLTPPEPGQVPLLLAADPVGGDTRFSLPVDELSETFSGMVVTDDAVVGLGGRCDGGTPVARAIDQQTGTTRWSTPLAGLGELSQPLSADGGVVVFATSREGGGQASVLTGIDVGTGERLWETDLGPVTDVQLRLDQPVVMASYQPQGQDGGPFTLVAIDRATGARRWETTNQGVAIVGGDDEVVVVQAFDDAPAMVGLDAATGAERWRNEDIEVTYVPLLGGGVVANTMLSGGVVGFDVATGEQRWARPDLALAELAEAQSGAGGTLALLSPDLTGTQLELVDLTDGTTRFELANEGGIVPTEHALLVDQGSTMAVRSVTDGSPIGAIALAPPEQDQVMVLPVVAPDGTVYLGRGCPMRG